MRDTNFSILTTRFLLITLLSLLAYAATACGGTPSDEAAPPDVEGPALVMFYTDN